jgi:prepilin peptidase CpaA
MSDIATRSISNKVCLGIAVLGSIRFAFLTSSQIIGTVAATGMLVTCLLAVYYLHQIGGGDLKLIAALAIGLPVPQLIQALMVMAAAGILLVIVHLLLRLLPLPSLPPVGSRILRRVYAIERWRNIRKAPLPFGVAIACGGVLTLLTY